MESHLSFAISGDSENSISEVCNACVGVERHHTVILS